jgi:hypothetical protein
VELPKEIIYDRGGKRRKEIYRVKIRTPLETEGNGQLLYEIGETATVPVTDGGSTGNRAFEK